ncbi:hypothetical protein PL8927_690048 [Planktothrix serta PCC 8927]|uniref:Uncharacterized protein n=1 Tax=Planktothrix serta PCC 8927 TaxID=671068 RepID=A0A7Z9BSV5_9CYAN|nr:hypothetical protein PL8927_690048 [Planktothrix serta PCC 8927]
MLCQKLAQIKGRINKKQAKNEREITSSQPSSAVRQSVDVKLKFLWTRLSGTR